MKTSYTLELGTNGRLVLPAEVRKHFEIQAGDVLILRVKEEGILEIQSGKDVALKTRGILKSLKPKKRVQRA